MDLKDLYRDVILDHNRSPRNFGPLVPADAQAHGHNPLCGDQLTVFLHRAANDGITAQFTGQGCAISIASASLMTEAVKGLSQSQITALFEKIHALLTKGDDSQLATLGKLAALSGVRDFPARVKCASLCWHTLMAALSTPTNTVSTE
jgi:nitrogen fixation protein NifU and related proteins